MKKYIDIAFIYAILGLISGVFYREFTKIYEFTGKTTLAYTHLHLFALGMLVFLIVALFVSVTNLKEQKSFKVFMILYNIALPFVVIMFYVRGILQVQGVELTKSLDSAISGMAGIAHILMTIAIVYLFLGLRKSKSKFEALN